MRDQLRRQRSARAGLIIDENRAEAGLHLVGPRPADDVEHAAGGKRQNQANGAVRVDCRRGKLRAAGERRGARSEMQKFPAREFHSVSLPCSILMRHYGAQFTLAPENFTTLAHLAVSS